MHPLKFDVLFPFVSRPTNLTQVSSAGCRYAVWIFDTNFNLVVTLGMVPGYSFMNGELWHCATVEAGVELKIADTEDSRVAKRASEIFHDEAGKVITGGHYAHFAQASKNAAEISSMPGRALGHGALHALLKAMVVQAWTSIEICLELIIKAIHAEHPSLLAGISKSEMRDCGFRSRRKLAKYFAYTFRADNKDIMAEIENDDITALALARNAIVHAGGKADADFVRDGTPIPVLAPLLASGANGNDMQFDGEIVRNLVSISRPRIYALVEAVDNWLYAHNFLP